MSSAFQEECLVAHNEYRKKHGAPPLVLNQKICQYSQNWAQTLANRDCGRLSLSHSSCHAHGYGENIAGASPQLSGRRSVEMWYNEIKFYHFGYSNSFSTGTGHFTQVVWKNSKELGVGRATSRSGNVYVVANYSPPGNYSGQFTANVLPLGTQPPPVPKPAPAPAAPAPAKTTPASTPSTQPKTTTDNSDRKSLVTKPLVHESFFDRQPTEIVKAVFDGRLGNCMGDRMRRGYHLGVNQYLMSQNGQYIAILQEDGNFVVYDKNAKVYFASNTYRKPSNQVQLRNDGHLTVVDKSKLENPFWISHKGADGGECFLIMQNDGNLVAYKGQESTDPCLAYFSVY